MTRETKIGLLVGLAFIIVIGILLSDHLTSSTEPPQAALAGAGNNVRSAVTVPGQPGPQPAPVTPPITVAPQNQVPTQNELTPAPNPVQIVKVGPGNTQQQQKPIVALNPSNAQQPQQQPPTVTNTDAPPSVAQAPVSPTNTTSTPLDSVARQHGEELIPLTPSNVNGRTPRGAGAQREGNAVATNGTFIEYKAEPGDSLSKIAMKVMGSGNKTNRDAIVALNPSLQANPDRVIVGRTYRIPTQVSLTSSAPIAPTDSQQVATAEQPVTTPQQPTTPAAENWYTIKEGDSLWRIASEQCGNANAIAAIKELNKDVLRGANDDIIQVGMKLRLPSKSLASAN